MIELTDNAPEDIEDFNFDIIQLKKDISHQEYNDLMDDDNSIDSYNLLDRYGLKYVNNDIWISTTDTDINAHDILNSLLYFPNQYEGIDSFILSDHYLIFMVSTAEGQGGGFAIIDLKNNGKWIFKTKEIPIQQILWIPTHKIFACIYDVSTYSSHNISLELIDLTGKHYSLQIFKHSASDGNNANLVRFVDNDPTLEYNESGDTIKYCEWEQKVDDVLNSVGFGE